MQELLLRQERFDQVVAGTKKSTSRSGVRLITLGPLEIAVTEDPKQRVVVNVNRVQLVKFEDLTEEEGLLEGYESLEAMKTSLDEIYGPGILPSKLFTLIGWE